MERAQKNSSLFDQAIVAVEKCGLKKVHAALMPHIPKKEVRISLTEKIVIAVSKSGSQKISKILSDLAFPAVKFTDSKVSRIVNTVCDRMRIQAIELIHGVSRSANKKIAFALCCRYLSKSLNKNPDEICEIMNRDPCNYHRANKLIRNLNPSHPGDAPFVQIKIELDQLFNIVDKPK